MSLEIDVCVPTWNSAPVLAETFDRLAASADRSDVTVDRVIVIDNRSDDDTERIAREAADTHGWNLSFITRSTALPEARQIAIEEVDTEWFLFLDDDVRIPDEYLGRLHDCIAPAIGAIQGRKASDRKTPWEWKQRRVHRGGTHATLLRTHAVEGISIPDDLDVLEDEYIRREVESNDYLWLFNHRARFRHDSMDRHAIGWQQGYLAGKYDLLPGHIVALSVFQSLQPGKPLTPRLKRLCGWTAGRLHGCSSLLRR